MKLDREISNEIQETTAHQFNDPLVEHESI